MSNRDRLTIDPSTLLACIPLFAGLPAQPVARLASGCRVLNLPVAGSLFKPGDPIEDAHFLVTGAIKRFAPVAEHAQRVIELVQPGRLFGLSEVFSAKSYASVAEAIEPSVIVAIPLKTLIEVAVSEPALSFRLLEAMAQRSYAAEFEATSHHSLSVTQRVLDYLLHLAGDNRNLAGETTVRLDASKKLIAARLDMAAETFSRTLRQLSEDGLIVVSGNFIHLQNATLATDQGHLENSVAIPLRYPKQDRGAKSIALSPAALINLCGLFRLLSQRIAVMWCLSTLRISADAANVASRKYRHQFTHNLRRLSGDGTPPGVADLLGRLTSVWQRYSDVLAIKPPALENAQTIFDLSEASLEAANKLTLGTALAAGTREANLVNIAGRNRMLSVRLTKLFLFQDMTIPAREALVLMNQCRSEFEANVLELRQRGDQTAGAVAQLEVSQNNWHHLNGLINQFKKVSRHHENIRAIVAASDELVRNLNTTVKLYERLAEKSQVLFSQRLPQSP